MSLPLTPLATILLAGITVVAPTPQQKKWQIQNQLNLAAQIDENGCRYAVHNIPVGTGTWTKLSLTSQPHSLALSTQSKLGIRNYKTSSTKADNKNTTHTLTQWHWQPLPANPETEDNEAKPAPNLLQAHVRTLQDGVNCSYTLSAASIATQALLDTQGKLSNSDLIDAQKKHYDIWSLPVKKHDSWLLRIHSLEFIPELTLVLPDGTHKVFKPTIAECHLDNDKQPTPSLLELVAHHTSTAQGEVIVIASSQTPSTGNYQLRIDKIKPSPTPLRNVTNNAPITNQ